MKTLTNESKARFFAQYIGTIFCTDFSNREDLIINWATILNIQTENDLFKTAKAILTPLQNISDEHAIELGKLLGYFAKDFSDGVDSVLRIIKNWITNLIKGNTKQYTNSVIITYQYLQSKSYASSHYCPIENRIIPVQEQIDNGWITLKTN